MNIAFTFLLISASLLQIGCQAQIDPVNSQRKQADSAPQASKDSELMKEVERFASNNSASSSAWQNLMRHDRQMLIDDLSRISSTLPADDRQRIFIAYAFCKMDHDYESNKQVMLTALSRNAPYRDLMGDWVVILIGNLAVDGDMDLLGPLFQAAEWSDGAMATDLSSVYTETLATSPERFLELLSIQPKTTRDAVIRLLHHHSLTPEQSKRVKDFLKTVRSPSKLTTVTAQILKILSK